MSTAKLTFPATVNAGQPVAGTVLYTNNGPSTASGTTFTLSVAANLAVAPTVTGLPAGASYAYVPATGAITLSGMPATLASGASLGPIGVGYTQPASGTSVVTASIGTTTIDSNPANNSATVTIGGARWPISRPALAFPATVNAGQPVAGTVLYTNNGPSSASGITFALSVAANLAVAPTVTGLPAGASYTYIPATGVINLSGMPATLASGASVGPISVGYTQPASGTSIVTASISAATIDPNPANNSATATIGGAAVADVAAKLNFPAAVNAGQPVAGTVLYTNNGPSTANGTAFTLSVAPNLAAAPTVTGLPAGAGFTYIPATGVINLSGMPATLASGASVGPIGVSYTQPGSATSTVGAAVTTTTVDSNLGNNSATATITGTAVADVAVKLNFPAAVNAGQPVAGTRALHQQRTEHGERHHVHLERCRQSRRGADRHRSARGRKLQLRSRHRRDHLERHAGRPSPPAQPRPDRHRLRSTGIRRLGRDRDDRHHHQRSESRQQFRHGDRQRRRCCRRRRQNRIFRPRSTPDSRSPAPCCYTNNGPSTASGTTFTLSVAANLAAPPAVTGLPAGASLQLRSRHRRHHLERHARNTRRGSDRGSDQRELHAAGIRNLHRRRRRRHHDHRSESRQQLEQGHDHRG